MLEVSYIKSTVYLVLYMQTVITQCTRLVRSIIYVQYFCYIFVKIPALLNLTTTILPFCAFKINKFVFVLVFFRAIKVLLSSSFIDISFVLTSYKRISSSLGQRYA